MTDSPEAVFERHVAALMAGDLDALAADYSEDALIITSDGEFRGQAGVREVFTPLMQGLPDPTLELRDVNGVLIASNDNWKDSQRAEIEATGIPPTNDLESALVRTIPTGNYTAILRGSGGSIGIAVVEAYNLP